MGGMPLTRARIEHEPYSTAAAYELQRELDVSPAVAAILVRRGHRTPGLARAFFAADDRHDPFEFEGMRDTCEGILRHVESRSPIVVHGDYDVDGVSSTAILVRALRALGADPAWHLPSRGDDGYGLSVATVEQLAGAGAGLLITADCGITSAVEVERALELGLDVVVTDHHRPGDRLPPCPIVHPAVSGYPFEELCAAGVAHKLAEALHAAAGEEPRHADEDLDLVALATVADLVPLRGENRRLVREGLASLARTAKPGLRALMKVASVEPGTLSARSLGFALGPRINAAGRMERADAALELLLTSDDERADEIAAELDQLNRERRDAETRILFAAEAAAAAQAHEAALVLAGEDWHGGVIGIVASRMVERYHRPCVVIAVDGEGQGKGSGRSIDAFDLHAGLGACSEHLTRFGGHTMAAGCELDEEAIGPFRRAFADHAAAHLTPRDLLPSRRVDAIVPAGAAGMALAQELRTLEPFGAGNPEPLLLVPAITTEDVRGMGDESQHARFSVAGGNARASAVAFRTPPSALKKLSVRPHDAAVRLELNEWGGAVEPRLVLEAVREQEGGAVEVLDGINGECGKTDRPDETPAVPGLVTRAVSDRRGEGLAGIAAGLISSGEPVLLVCAHCGRRREGVEATLAGFADDDSLALTSWSALEREPSLAAPYAHVIAIDPPRGEEGERLLARLPARHEPAFAHLVWGAPEVEFALAVARSELALRPTLEAAYRALRRSDGASVEIADRDAAAVLVELGLARPEREGDLSSLLLASDPDRTELERSPTYRARAAELAAAEAYLAGGARQLSAA